MESHWRNCLMSSICFVRIDTKIKLIVSTHACKQYIIPLTYTHQQWCVVSPGLRASAPRPRRARRRARAVDRRRRAHNFTSISYLDHTPRWPTSTTRARRATRRRHPTRSRLVGALSSGPIRDRITHTRATHARTHDAMTRASNARHRGVSTSRDAPRTPAPSRRRDPIDIGHRVAHLVDRVVVVARRRGGSMARTRSYLASTSLSTEHAGVVGGGRASRCARRRRRRCVDGGRGTTMTGFVGRARPRLGVRATVAIERRATASERRRATVTVA